MATIKNKGKITHSGQLKNSENVSDDEKLPNNWKEWEGFKDKSEDQAIEIMRSIKILAELSFLLYTVTKKQASNSKVLNINVNRLTKKAA